MKNENFIFDNKPLIVPNLWLIFELYSSKSVIKIMTSNKKSVLVVNNQVPGNINRINQSKWILYLKAWLKLWCINYDSGLKNVIKTKKIIYDLV